MYISHWVISTLDPLLAIQSDIILSEAFHFFQGAEQLHGLPEVQLQEKQQLVTPDPGNFTATLQTQTLFQRCEVSFDPISSF